MEAPRSRTPAVSVRRSNPALPTIPLLGRRGREPGTAEADEPRKCPYLGFVIPLLRLSAGSVLRFGLYPLSAKLDGLAPHVSVGVPDEVLPGT